MGGNCQHLEIAALRERLAQWEKSARSEKAAAWRQALGEPAADRPASVVSSGLAALDALLPDKGFRLGTLVEWLSTSPGDGTAALAFAAAAEALKAAENENGSPEGRAAVVLDSRGEFYPPATVERGIEPSRLIVVHPANKADHTWALDQVLRCPAVAVAVAWPDGAIKGTVPICRNGPEGAAHKWGLSPLLPHKSKFDSHTFRRLQLAVEQGGGLGLLIRPAAVRDEPSWADVRLLVESLASASSYGRPQMRIAILRCRGGRGEKTIEVEIDHEPHRLHPS